VYYVTTYNSTLNLQAGGPLVFFRPPLIIILCITGYLTRCGVPVLHPKSLRPPPPHSPPWRDWRKQLWGLRRKWGDNIKLDIKRIRVECGIHSCYSK